MGKEVKIGLAVIAVLLSVFAAVLYTRLSGGDTTVTAAAKDPMDEKDKKDKDDKRKDNKKNHKKSLSSGPSPAEVAAKHRSDRSSSSSKRRPFESEADDSRYPDIGRDDVSAGQDDGIGSPYRRSNDRYGNRDRVGYGKADDSPTDDTDDTSGVATLDDSAMTVDDAGNDPENGAVGENAAYGDAEKTVEGVPELKRFDRAMGSSGHDNRGKHARLSDTDELVSTEPPSELGPADIEAPLSPDEDDKSVVETVGGNRFSRGQRDGSDKRPFSTASRRDAAPMESADDGDVSDAEDTLDIEGETYTVRPNDNYWIISQRVYGTGSYFKALQEFNRDRYPNPDRLDVGDEVGVPKVAVLEQSYPKLCPKRRHVAAQRRTATLASSRSGEVKGEKVYTVAEGDTLFDIARHELGSAERWAEILDLNRDQLGEDIHYLTPGTRLMLPGDNQPGDEPQDRVTTRPRRRGASRR